MKQCVFSIFTIIIFIFSCNKSDLEVTINKVSVLGNKYNIDITLTNNSDNKILLTDIESGYYNTTNNTIEVCYYLFDYTEKSNNMIFLVEPHVDWYYNFIDSGCSYQFSKTLNIVYKKCLPSGCSDSGFIDEKTKFKNLLIKIGYIPLQKSESIYFDKKKMKLPLIKKFREKNYLYYQKFVTTVYSL